MSLVLDVFSCSSRGIPTTGLHNPSPDADLVDPDLIDPDLVDPAPGQPASSLISHMLDTYKPPELIHAGAALLRRDHG